MSLFSFQGRVWAGERLPNGKLSRLCGPERTGLDPADGHRKYEHDGIVLGQPPAIWPLAARQDRHRQHHLRRVAAEEHCCGDLGLADRAAADTVTGEVLEGDLKAGDFVKLDRQFVSSWSSLTVLPRLRNWPWVRTTVSSRQRLA